MQAETAKKPDIRSRGPEVLAYMATVLAEHLGKEGLPTDKASGIALNVMEVMRFEFGGQNIYFPMASHMKAEDKGDEIYDKFMAGATVPDLAFEYQHSIQWVYKLISQGRAKRKAQRAINDGKAQNDAE